MFIVNIHSDQDVPLAVRQLPVASAAVDVIGKAIKYYRDKNTYAIVSFYQDEKMILKIDTNTELL